MFDIYDRMFDFNRDGKLDICEQAEMYEYYDKCIQDDTDDETDIFADAGLNYEELECMDPEERREALEGAGLDPDDFDF